MHEMRKKAEEKARIEEKQKKAIDMYQDGKTLEEIQEATGYLRNSIFTLLRTRGIREPEYTGGEPVPIYKAVERRKLRKVKVNGKHYTDVFDYIGGV